MATLGDLNVKIGVDDSAAKSGMDSAANTAKNKAGSIAESFGKAGNAFRNAFKPDNDNSFVNKLDNLKNKFKEARDTAEKSGSGGFGFGVAAGVGMKAIGAITGSVGSLINQTVSASDAMQKFNSTMEFAGITGEPLKKAGTAAKKYADDTVYDLQTITNTTAQLASNGIKNYTELTEAAGNVNAVAGGNADTFKSVAMMLTQTAGAGKLTTENWNQLSDAIPGASGKLQEAMKKNGAFTGNFRDAMEKGQISADEFNQALTDLGNTDVAKKAATSTQTFEGAVGNLQANIVTQMNKVIDNIGKEKLTDIINSIGDTVGKLIGFFAKLVVFWKDNSSWLTPVIAGIAGAVVAINMITAALTVFNAITAVSSALLSPIIIIVLAIAAAIAIVVAVVMNWGKISKWFGELWKSVVDGVKGALDGFVNFFNGMINVIWSFIQGWFNLAKAYITAEITVIAVIIGTAINLIKSVIEFVLNTIVSIFTAIWGVIGGVITTAWNFYVGIITAVLSTIWNVISSVFNAVFGFISTVFNAIAGVVSSIWNGIVNIIDNVARTIWNTITGVFNGLVGVVSGIFNGVKNAIHSAMSGASDIVRNIINAIKGFFSFSIHWPHIPMPHFKINPRGWEIGDLLKGKIPSLGIDFYAKGGIMTAPTIFGMNGGNAMVGGEAGREAVLPLNRDTLGKIGDGIVKATQQPQAEASKSYNVTQNIYSHDSLTPREMQRQARTELEKFARDL